jgi:hypothetical protein
VTCHCPKTARRTHAASAFNEQCGSTEASTPAFDCRLFPDGWLIAGGADPNRFPAPESRWRAGAPQQVRHPFVLPSDRHVHGVERPHLWLSQTSDDKDRSAPFWIISSIILRLPVTTK